MVVTSYMHKKEWLLVVILSVMGLQVSAIRKGNPTPLNIAHNYRIYFFSEEGADMDAIYGSYLQIRPKAGVGIVYDYYIKEDQHVEGNVEQYNAVDNEQRYVLARFFKVKSNALLRVFDMPNCDNMKVAVIQYANEKEDSLGVFLQYILTEGEVMTPLNK